MTVAALATTTLERVTSLLIPARRRGVELLDDPGADAALATRTLRDVALANRCFGGTSAVIAALEPMLRQPRAASAALSLLDVGTGLGDIPARARHRALRHGSKLMTIGLERTTEVAAAARGSTDMICVGDGLALPFATKSIDIVTCSQVLHHFADDEAAFLLREMHRVARRLVVVADLRRSWLAAGGIWAASFALGFHPVSRHDGVLSVLRGYRTPELARLVHRAVGTTPRVTDHRGFRVIASWSPS